MADRLAGKVAVMTGGTSGIGEASARRFVEEGDLRFGGRALATELGAQALFQHADVTDEKDIESAVNTAVAEFGQLDCLFTPANSPSSKPTLRAPTPLPRTGFADDIAHAAVYLASDEGSFVNSHDLVVDGGRISQFYGRPVPT